MIRYTDILFGGGFTLVGYCDNEQKLKKCFIIVGTGQTAAAGRSETAPSPAPSARRPSASVHEVVARGCGRVARALVLALGSGTHTAPRVASVSGTTEGGAAAAGQGTRSLAHVTLVVTSASGGGASSHPVSSL